MIPTTVHALTLALIDGLALVGAGALAALGWHLLTGSDVGGWLEHRRRLHRAQHTARAVAYRRQVASETSGWLAEAFGQPDPTPALTDHPGQPAPLPCEDCGHTGQVTVYSDATGTRLVCVDNHACLSRQHHPDRRPSTDLVPIR